MKLSRELFRAGHWSLDTQDLLERRKYHAVRSDWVSAAHRQQTCDIHLAAASRKVHSGSRLRLGYLVPLDPPWSFALMIHFDKSVEQVDLFSEVHYQPFDCLEYSNFERS